MVCDVEIYIRGAISPPVFLFYEIRDMYQNHRRYVDNRNDEQLDSDDPYTASVSSASLSSFKSKVLLTRIN